MEFIDKKLAQFGSKPGLERMKKIMDRLDNPQSDYPVIIVSGTNGKGSATSFISSILTASGSHVGSYYSPHLVSYAERFQINQQPIQTDLLKRYESEMESLFDRGVEMTAFEALTAICYKYFSDQDIDVAVMEVGMGGEHDATAIANPIVGVITNVELDHTEYLGSNVEAIARTKAGILKKGSKCVTGCTKSTLKEIDAIAKQNNSKTSALGREFFVEPVAVSSKGNKFNYLGIDHYEDLETRLIGRHQVDNAGIAISAVETYSSDVSESAIRTGLIEARNPGRLEMIRNTPRVLIDAAHNPSGIGSLVTSLSLFDFEKLIVVFGVLSNKDWKEMLRILGQHADLIIANKPIHEGSMDPDELVKEASRYVQAKKVTNVKESVDYARSIAGEKDLVVVCGSIYMLGELLSE